MDCTFCGKETTQFMDYGDVSLAGAFLKPEDFAHEKKYPLTLHFCEHCYAVEVGEKIDPDILFKNYFYHSSAIPSLQTHFKEYADHLVDRFAPESVLEIGCNDGVMLRHFDVARKVGVDPSSAAKGVQHVINDYFTEKLSEELGQFDIVVANNVLAHIADIHDVIRGVSKCMKKHGVFVFEVHSLEDMLDKTQYDWVYHEHLYYYSFLALENFLGQYGMKIFDIEKAGTHAGSRRYYVCKDDRPTTEIVHDVREIEKYEGLNRIEIFDQFRVRAEALRDELMAFLNYIKAEGKRVVGYGACGRANTMIQYCGITHEHMEYIVDDAPAKENFYTPGSHFQIKRYQGSDFPHYFLVFAWSFYSDIFRKILTKALIPLPIVHVRSGA